MKLLYLVCLCFFIALGSWCNVATAQEEGIVMLIPDANLERQSDKPSAWLMRYRSHNWRWRK